MFQAAPTCTGGKIFLNCQHQVMYNASILIALTELAKLQVIYGTKYIVKKESTRDHVDLLLSLKHWPIVYAADMARDVVAHIAVREPRLASEMWGEHRGCFEKPSSTYRPQVGDTSILHKII